MTLYTFVVNIMLLCVARVIYRFAVALVYVWGPQMHIQGRKLRGTVGSHKVLGEGDVNGQDIRPVILPRLLELGGAGSKGYERKVQTSKNVSSKWR
jgi:hypothetical protein